VPVGEHIPVVTLQAEGPKAPKETSRKSFRGVSTSESSTLMDCLDEVEGDIEVEVPPPSPFPDDEEPAPSGQAATTAWVLVPIPTLRIDQVPSEAERLQLVQNFGDWLAGVSRFSTSRVQLADSFTRTWKARANEAKARATEAERRATGLQGQLETAIAAAKAAQAAAKAAQMATEELQRQADQYKLDRKDTAQRAETAEKKLKELQAKILVPVPKDVNATQTTQEHNVATLNTALVKTQQVQVRQMGDRIKELEDQLQEASTSTPASGS
jgi:uncharacterized coiled-coil protein SlyX